MLTRSAIRAFSTEALKVVNNVAKQQFKISLPSVPVDAVLSYDKSGQKITFISTDVPEQFQGKGVGKILAQHAFNYALDNKLDVTCKCHFLANYYDKNKNKYKDIKIEFDLE